MRTRFLSTMVLVALLASPGALLASPVYIGTSPLVPPTDGVYVSPQNAHAEYDAAPGLQIILQDIRHSGFTNIVRSPFSGGTSETFDSSVVGNVSVNGGPLSPISLSGPVQVLLFSYSPGDLGTFNTQMTALSLQSTGGVEIRQSPTKVSTGQTTITSQGGGQFLITSFFDIFTELSLDGGQNWIPSVDKTHVDLTNTPLPDALPLFATGLGGLGLLGWRRNKKAAAV